MVLYELTLPAMNSTIYVLTHVPIKYVHVITCFPEDTDIKVYRL